MRRAIRAELLKLRSVALPVGLFGAATAVTLLIVVLEGVRAGGHGHIEIASLRTGAGQTSLLTATDFGLLFALVLGVTVATGEFWHRTATSTALAIPDRSRVLAAKAVTAAGAGAGFGLGAAVVTTAVTLVFLAIRGGALVVPAATVLRDGLGAVLGGGLLAAVGVAVGSLVRSQLAAVLGVLIWALIAESSLGGLFPTTAPYLPYTAASGLAGSGGFGRGAHAQALPFPVGVLLVAAVAAVLALAAARTTVRRDIA